MIQNKFLTILKASLEGSTLSSLSLQKEQTDTLLKLAETHRVLPLVFDCIFPSLSPCAKENYRSVHQSVKLMVSKQALRTEAFLNLYKDLANTGLTPITIKGIVCRNLYPSPDFRISADEDLLIPPAEYSRYRQTLIHFGFSPYKETTDSYQTSFIRSDGFHIELHTSLFDHNQPYFSRWNSFFADVFSHTQTLQINSVNIATLSATDHLLYLVLHALKHFIHSGVGIRQICDIVVFSRYYINHIDWDYIFTKCKDLSAYRFLLGILAIGKNHLNLSEYIDRIPVPDPLPDEKNLLEDILSAGIYGDSTLSRKHSASITFNAAKRGKKQGIISNILPPRKVLSHRYSYAKRNPVLLPVAWGHRLVNYGKELKKTENNNPTSAISIGNKRADLLREYGLIHTSEKDT